MNERYVTFVYKQKIYCVLQVLLKRHFPQRNWYYIPCTKESYKGEATYVHPKHSKECNCFRDRINQCIDLYTQGHHFDLRLKHKISTEDSEIKKKKKIEKHNNTMEAFIYTFHKKLNL